MERDAHRSFACLYLNPPFDLAATIDIGLGNIMFSLAIASFAATIIFQGFGSPIHCLDLDVSTQNSHRDYMDNFCWNSELKMAFSDQGLQAEHSAPTVVPLYRLASLVFLLQAIVYGVLFYHSVPQHLIPRVSADRLILSCRPSTQRGQGHYITSLEDVDVIAERIASALKRRIKQIEWFQDMVKVIRNIIILALIIFLLDNFIFEHKTPLSSFYYGSSLVDGNRKYYSYLPDVVLCSFEYVDKGYKITHSAQCNLPFNVYLKIMFTISWYISYLSVVVSVIIGCVTRFYLPRHDARELDHIRNGVTRACHEAYRNLVDTIPPAVSVDKVDCESFTYKCTIRVCCDQKGRITVEICTWGIQDISYWWSWFVPE